MMLKDDFFLIKKWFDETIEQAKTEAIADGCPLSQMHQQLPQLKDRILKERGIDPSEFYAYEESYGNPKNIEKENKRKNRSIEEQKIDKLDSVLYSFVHIDKEDGYNKYQDKRKMALAELSKENWENFDEVIQKYKNQVDEEFQTFKQTEEDEKEKKQKREEVKKVAEERELARFLKEFKMTKQESPVEEDTAQELSEEPNEEFEPMQENEEIENK